MRDRTTLATVADVAAFIDDVLDQAERGRTTYRHAASRIVGLGALDLYYEVWVPKCDELDDVHSVAGMIEGAAVASDHWHKLREAAKRLRAAAKQET
jgi:hypothetical protein